MTWQEWFREHSLTLAITLGFASGGSLLLLWLRPGEAGPWRFLLAWAAGQLVGASAAVAAHGYVGVSFFFAPLIGLCCGIVAVPLLRAVMRVSMRVEKRADDLGDRAIDVITKGGHK